MIPSLPKEFSDLKNLEVLNLNNNPFSSFSDMVEVIKKLPLLKNLTTNLEDNDQVKLVLQEIKKIEILNNEIATPEEIKEIVNGCDTIPEESEYKEEIENTQQGIEKIIKIYDLIVEMENKSPDNEFEEFIKTKIELLKEDLKQENDPIQKKSLVFSSIESMLEICFKKLGETIDNPLKNILMNIKDSYKWAIESLVKIKISPEEGLRIKELKEQLEENNLTESNKIDELKSEINKLKEDFEIERSELKSKIKELSQKEKSFENIYEKSELVGKQLLKFNEGGHLPRENSSLKSPLQAMNNVVGNLSEESVNKVHKMPSGNYSQAKSLTIRQLKDLIQDIFTQKQKFDMKCSENHEPRQTLEQFMYTYLNQHYGLKSIIIEWTSNIINAIKRYSSEDNDVALFGKILRNECEEEFRFIQLKIKSTINEIIRERITSKNKLKREKEVNKMLNDIINGNIPEGYWVEIIKRIFTEEHYKILEQRLKQIIKDKQQISLNTDCRKLTRLEQKALKENKEMKIQYNEFLKILLDFQLKSHEKYLRKFIKFFQAIDNDMNGILNEEEFRQLLNNMKISDSVTTNLLQKVDPYNNQEITFSECIAILSAEVEKGRTNILDNFLNDLSIE